MSYIIRFASLTAARVARRPDRISDSGGSGSLRVVLDASCDDTTAIDDLSFPEPVTSPSSVNTDDSSLIADAGCVSVPSFIPDASEGGVPSSMAGCCTCFEMGELRA